MITGSGAREARTTEGRFFGACFGSDYHFDVFPERCPTSTLVSPWLSSHGGRRLGHLESDVVQEGKLVKDTRAVRRQMQDVSTSQEGFITY